jgi:hypothetical protein
VKAACDMGVRVWPRKDGIAPCKHEATEMVRVINAPWPGREIHLQLCPDHFLLVTENLTLGEYIQCDQHRHEEP